METIPGHLERIPKGGDRAQAEMLSGTQRERIMRAFAQLVAKRGYRPTTIEMIVRRAGVSRGTFYENFENREACLSAVVDSAWAEISRLMDEAAPGEAWPDRIRAGLAALLDFVAENPDLARTCFVESMSGGPEVVADYEKSLGEFGAYFAEGRKHAAPDRPLPELLEDAVVGGIVWTIHQRLLHGEADRVPELLPTITEFALVPYLGESPDGRPGRASA